MTREKIKELFAQGIDCSQVVTETFAKKMHMSVEEARKVAACFGGGMMCGETCGAVTGALMVIGTVYGHSAEADMEQKNVMMAKVAAFKEQYAKKRSSTLCRDLLGHDISKEGELEKVLEEGLMFSFCPGVVEDVIDILEEIL